MVAALFVSSTLVGRLVTRGAATSAPCAVDGGTLVACGAGLSRNGCGYAARMNRESGSMLVLMVIAAAVAAVAGFLASDGSPAVAAVAALLGGVLGAVRWALPKGARRAGQRMRGEG